MDKLTNEEIVDTGAEVIEKASNLEKSNIGELAAALNIVNARYKEYRDRVIERFGEKDDNI